MALFNVHIYREMRLFYPNIDANTHEDAARIANEKPTDEAVNTEECDGTTLSALVDVVGDTEFADSQMIDFQGGQFLSAGQAMLDALEEIEAQLDTFKPTAIASLGLSEALMKVKAAITKAKAKP